MDLFTLCLLLLLLLLLLLKYVTYDSDNDGFSLTAGRSVHLLKQMTI